MGTGDFLGTVLGSSHRICHQEPEGATLCPQLLAPSGSQNQGKYRESPEMCCRWLYWSPTVQDFSSSLDPPTPWDVNGLSA